jgi:chromosome segregation ATPase
LDIDEVMLQFDAIERKVGQLVEQVRSLKARNGELTERVEVLEEELRQKAEAENTYAEQKALIRSKIDGLLTKLDEIDTTASDR